MADGKGKVLIFISYSHGAARDLDEVEETAEPGPMRLYLCDLALERARLAFAKNAHQSSYFSGLVSVRNAQSKPVAAAEMTARSR